MANYTETPEYFIRLGLMPSSQDVAQLTIEQQRTRWLAANDIALFFRDQLAGDKAALMGTQLERQAFPDEKCVMLRLKGDEKLVRPFMVRLKQMAEVNLVSMELLSVDKSVDTSAQKGT